MPLTINHHSPQPKRHRRRTCHWILIVLTAVLLAGCAGAPQTKKAPISPGMSPEAVTTHLGEPDSREQFAPDRYVYFYDQGPFMGRPICFDKHEVVHVGPELLDAWRQERLAVAERVRTTGALSAKAKARVKATLKAERDARIAELERTVKPFPVSATLENLKIYRELLSLAPDNERYQRKVAFYSQRHEAEQAEKRKAAEMAVKKKQESERQHRNKALRVYEGNAHIEMAVHELGGGEIYIWVKNLSNEPLVLASGHFRLLDSAAKPIALRVAEELEGLISTGGIAYGKLIFDQGAKPDRLVLAHPKAGTIEKMFP